MNYFEGSFAICLFLCYFPQLPRFIKSSSIFSSMWWRVKFPLPQFRQSLSIESYKSVILFHSVSCLSNPTVFQWRITLVASPPPWFPRMKLKKLFWKSLNAFPPSLSLFTMLLGRSWLKTFALLTLCPLIPPPLRYFHTIVSLIVVQDWSFS